MCKPPNRGCTLLDTSEVAHYVISHDLANLPIFRYDYKLCLSTIITFENIYYNKLYTIIVQTGQYISVFSLLY